MMAQNGESDNSSARHLSPPPTEPAAQRRRCLRRQWPARRCSARRPAAGIERRGSLAL